MESFTPAIRPRAEGEDEEDDQDYMPGPDVKKRLFDCESETPLRPVLKQPVVVYLRVRPKHNQELKEPDFFQVVDENAILATSIKDGSRERFLFTNVFQPSASQKDVFSKAVMPILKDFFDGQNCLLFTYGITNSGKTHTIMGTAADPGVLPRALDVVFNSIGKGRMMGGIALKPKHFSEVRTLSSNDQTKEKDAKDKLMAQARQVKSSRPLEGSIIEDDVSNTSKVSTISNTSDVTGELFGLEGYQIHETTSVEVSNSDNCYFSIWISFVEIYNEAISDLLAGGTTVKLKEDKHKNFFIDGAKEVSVGSVEEALLLLKLGLQQRHVAGTKLNYQSSRSHSIYTIKCIRTTDNDKPSHAMVNRISIIDLAGTERSAKTGAQGQRVKEAGKINQSLMVLGRCITAMRHNQTRTGEDQMLIPCRESRLTQLFQNYLVGKGKGVKQGKISMVVNVSNNVSVYDETINVLRFSALTSKVVPIARPVVTTCVNTESEDTLVPRPSDMEASASSSSSGGVDISEASAACSVEPSKCTCSVDIDAYRSHIQQLQVELIEQEAKIRAEVCLEFQQQLTEIEENHSKEMEDQQQELTSLYEGRIRKLNETTKKMKGHKRRRPNDTDEEDGDHTISSEETVRLELARLKEYVKELESEHQLERDKAVAELKDLTETYEANMVRLNEQLNDATLKLLNSEKSCQQLCEERQLCDANVVHLNEQLNDATLKLLNSEKSCQQLCEERQLCDANVVHLNEQLNDATLKLLNSEKSCQQLCDERQLCDANVVHLNEQLNDATLKLLNSEKSCQQLCDERQLCDANVVRLNEQLNDATLKLLNSEKSCQQLCEERQLCDANVVHLNEQLNDATLKLLNSEKSCQQLCDERQLCDANVVRLNEQLNDATLKLLDSEKSRQQLCDERQLCDVLKAEVEGHRRQCDEVRANCQEQMHRQLLSHQSELRAAADRHEAEMAVQRDEYQVEVDILQSRISELVREVEGLQGGKDEHTAEVSRHSLVGGRKSMLEVQSLLMKRTKLSEDVKVEEESKLKLVEEIQTLLEEKTKLSEDVKVEEESKLKLVEEIQTLLEEKTKLSEDVKVGEESKLKLVDEIQTLLEEKTKLSEDVKVEEESKLKLVDEIQTLLEEKTKLSEDVKVGEESKLKLVDEIQTLLEEKTKLSEDVKVGEESKLKLVEEIQTLLEEKTKLSEEVGGLISDREDKMAGLKEELNICASERSKLQNHLQLERMEKVKVQAEKDARAREVAELRAVIEQRTAELCSMGTQVEDLEAKNAELSGGLKESFSSTLEELNGTLQRQKDRISELTSDLGRLQRENEEFVESSIDLQMQVQKATSSRDTYSNQVEELTNAYEDLQRSSSQRESKLLDVIDQTKSAVEEQVADLRNRCATLEHQLTVAKETASELQLYVRRKEEELLEAQKQSSRLQVQSLEAAQALTTKMEELNTSLSALVGERDRLKEALKEEGERHQAELESLQGNYQLEKAHLSIRVRDLEASEAKKTEALHSLEAMEAKRTKAVASEKKTRALLAQACEESNGLRDQVEALKRSVDLSGCGLAEVKVERDRLQAELAKMKDNMDTQQERDLMFEEQRKCYEVQLRKLKEELRAELKEKEGLRAELKEKEGLRAELQKDTIKMEDSHGDLNCSKPYLPLMENSQLIESFEDPVKEEREEIHLDMTPGKAGRGGRKRKASPAAAIDSVSKQESPVKRQRSSRRKQLPTTALQQDENVDLEVKPAQSTYSKLKEQLSDLLPSKPAKGGKRTKLLKSQISGPLEVVNDVAGSTPISTRGKFKLGMELRAPRALRSGLV